jgi:hypothetical protein
MPQAAEDALDIETLRLIDPNQKRIRCSDEGLSTRTSADGAIR